VVKWISQLASDQSFWVRVLAGAQNEKGFLLQALFHFDLPGLERNFCAIGLSKSPWL
jgi:hypothetical protein